MLNMTVVRMCKKTMRQFKTKVKSCMAKTGCEACQCWRSQRLSASIEVIKSCSLSSASKLTAVDNKYCRGNFSACRRYEDESIGVLAACGRTAESLLLTAKKLKYNFSILGNVMERTHRLLVSRTSPDDQSSLSCSDLLKSNENLLNYVIENPLSVLDLEAIEGDSSVTSQPTSSTAECSLEDKINLDFQMKLLDSATKIILNTLTSVQENLKKKYFFDHILGFMKFITDEPSIN